MNGYSGRLELRGSVEIRRLRGGFQSYSDLAPELAVSRDAA